MRQKKQLILTFLASSVIALGGVSFLIYEQKRELSHKALIEESNRSDLALAHLHVVQGKPIEALKLAKKHFDEIEKGSDIGNQWLDLTLSCGKILKDSQFLTELYEAYPNAFREKEEIALEVAFHLLSNQKKGDFEELKEWWAARTSYPERWMFLDLDLLAMEGKTSLCREKLSAKTLRNPYESERLTRLALLSLNEHPKVAFEYLSDAIKADPNNLDLRLYRAHLLAAYGKESLAIEELKALIEKQPSDPFLKEELGDLYLRANQENTAFNLYQANLLPPSSDAIWLKALFLSKVLNPLPFNLMHYSIPEGSLNPLINYLLANREKYWDLERNSPLEAFSNLEEVFWLKLIAFLKEGKEIEAHALLQDQKEMSIYQPGLKSAVAQVIELRHPNLQIIAFEELEKLNHPLFKQIKNPPYSHELQNLMTGSEAFSALFLAAGWPEAALYLSHPSKEDSVLPSWYSYGMTQVLSKNRSVDEAIQFASSQKRTPQLALLVGELYLTTKTPQLGQAKLWQLARFENPVGQRAAALLAKDYIDRGDLSAAREAIGINEGFFQTLEAKKLLAALSFNVGDLTTAEAVYATFDRNSQEARSYLANKAFQNGNYSHAYKLTLELLKENPTSLELRENLKKIASLAKEAS